MNTYFKPMKMVNCKLFSFVIVYFNWTDYFFAKLITNIELGCS